jgi:hypothetical protein
MRIVVAGTDRAAEWAPAIEAEVARMAARKDFIFLPPSISALRLREARDEREYLDILTELVRRRHHIDTLDFRPPRRPGLAGALMGPLRMLLWRLLRYQHDRIAFRQNQVNSCFMALIELQGIEIDRLRRRLREQEDSLSR